MFQRVYLALLFIFIIFKVVSKSQGYFKLAPVCLFVYLGFILEEICWKSHISASEFKKEKKAFAQIAHLQTPVICKP